VVAQIQGQEMISKLKLLAFKPNWHTYAAVLAGLAYGTLDGLHYYHIADGVQIPNFIAIILGFLGIAGIRYGMNTTQKATAGAVANVVYLVEQILGQVTVQEDKVPQQVEVPGGPTITIGKPSPVQSDAAGRAETAALNRAQL
jgi:ABC-type xylose transport system permease subunit